MGQIGEEYRGRWKLPVMFLLLFLVEDFFY